MFRMKMMKRYILSAALFCLPLCAFAQNINPTVQVTNDFQGKIMEVHKGELPIAVADSLLKFDWNFDYAVTDNPYRGAYDFTPYLIDTTPEAAPLKQGKLYLRAGAGYTFHPEASLVYTPLAKPKAGLSVYDDFGGFSGNMLSFECRPAIRENLIRSDAHNGNMYRNRLGVNGRVSLGKPELLFDAGMDMLRSDSFISGADYGAADIKGSLNLNFNNWTAVVDAGFRHGDNIQSTSDSGDFDMDDNVLDLGFTLAHQYAPGSWFEFHPSVKTDFFNYYGYDGEVSHIKLSAVYKADFKRSHLRAGVLLSFVMGSVEEGMTFLGSGSVKPARGNCLYPDLYADYLLVPQTLKVYASLTGGAHVDELKDVLDERPFVLPSRTSALFGDVVSTPYDAEMGIAGRVGAKLQYKVGLGYRSVKNELAESVQCFTGSYIAFPQMLRVNYNLLHFDAQMDFTAERYKAAFDLTLQKSDFDPFVEAVALPKVKASGSFTYNWNKRIYAGISASYMGRRTQQYLMTTDTAECGIATKIPGYLDLGLNAEYRYNHRLSFWLRSGNLLCQSVYQQVLFARRSPWFTLGLTFAL